jgi:hypothetical protein
LIKTDQQSLKYITEQKVSEGIQHKLMLKLLEFNYKIEYKKGKENKVADALSRRDSLMMAVTAVTPAWASTVETSYTNDDHCKSLLEKLTVSANAAPPYTLHSGILR